MPPLRNSSRMEKSAMKPEHPELPALKDEEIFHVLVFFLRFGRLRSNGRPRTRESSVEFLRAQFPRKKWVSPRKSRASSCRNTG